MGVQEPCCRRVRRVIFLYNTKRAYQIDTLVLFCLIFQPSSKPSSPLPLRYHSEGLPKEERSVIVPLWLRTPNYNQTITCVFYSSPLRGRLGGGFILSALCESPFVCFRCKEPLADAIYSQSFPSHSAQS